MSISYSYELDLGFSDAFELYDSTIENNNIFSFKKFIQDGEKEKYHSTVVIKADNCSFEIIEGNRKYLKKESRKKTFN